MTPLFLHGWGFDASIWAGLSAILGGAAIDRGYFGAASDPIFPPGPLLAIGHSLGALLLLGSPPPDVCGLVVINGFDRFAADDAWPGTPRRVLDRMIARFEDDPSATLAAFRARCGAPPPPPIVDRGRLGDDLRQLRDADVRDVAAAWPLPLLALQGSGDPILPPGLREQAFGGASRREHVVCPGGGHLLPLTHAAWCAAQIAGFARRIA